MLVQTDYILNRKPVGDSAIFDGMSELRWDPGLSRPYFDERGRNCVLVNTGKRDAKTGKRIFAKREVMDLAINHGMSRLTQNVTSLLKDQWITMTNRVIAASREKLTAWTDLMAASPYGGFDGYSTMALEYQTMSDAGEAIIDFDGMTEGRNDNPVSALDALPMPITHGDFFFSERLLAISRRQGTPLNLRMAENVGRRIAEKVEAMTIGTLGAINLGGSSASGFSGVPYSRAPKIYGYLNHPAAITMSTVTVPTGANPEATVGNVLAMIDLANNQNFDGPFMLYHSTDWNIYMDNDYARLGGSNANMTLRDRLRRINGIRDVKPLRYLRPATHPFTLLLVQMTSEVAQAVNGMDMTVIQWPSMGGQRINFKVMCIHVPLIVADYYDRTGIVIGQPA